MGAGTEQRERIVTEARRRGISRIGFVPAGPPAGHEQFRRWLAAGMAGTMTYLNRQERRRANPALLMRGVRTIISLGEDYFTGWLPPDVRNDPSRGLIAAYAWGADYHQVFKAKVRALAEWIEASIDGVHCLTFVDSGPVAERDFATRAGLGFVGKNTMLIAPRAGSYGFLGEIFTTAELAPSPPRRRPGCGSCTRCLTLCPTQAFPAESVLDSRRCISYLTIEYRGVIPRELRGALGNHIFGCDDCQRCCPWNERFATPTPEHAYEAAVDRCAPKLIELARLTAAEYEMQFGGSAVLRATHRMMLRNVAVALGNWRTDAALEGLERLLTSPDWLVRAHAVGAVAQVETNEAVRMLARLRGTETDPRVMAEFRGQP
jgi:epoxyqueuosine reductase